MKYKTVKDIEDNQCFAATFDGLIRLNHIIEAYKQKGYKTIGEIEIREYTKEKYSKCWVQLMEK